MQRRLPSARIIGLAAVVLGGWLIATQVGINLLAIDRIWPVFLIVAGGALFVQFRSESRKRAGLAFPATLLFLTGITLLPFSLRIGELTLRKLPIYWPLLLVILGACFLAVYIARNAEEPSLLLPTYVFGGLGLLFLPFVMGIVTTRSFQQAIRLWPLALILIFLVFIYGTTLPEQPE